MSVGLRGALNRAARVAALAAMGLGLVVDRSSAGESDDLLNILGAGASGKSAAEVQGEGNQIRFLKKHLGSVSPEQRIFAQFFDEEKYPEALFQWSSAFEGTAFEKTPTALALKDYLFFRNGLPVHALEQLLSEVSKPEAIDSTVAQLWREAAPSQSGVWGQLGPVNWSEGWTKIFGTGAEVRLLGRNVFSADEVEGARELLKKTQPDTAERAWLTWQVVLALAAKDDVGTAGKALALLMNAPNNPVSKPLMTLTAARLLYQGGFLDAANKYYEKVPKGTDEWFEAQEESAWTHLRRAEPQNALASTKGLVLPVFDGQVGPSVFRARAVSQLKVCDYVGVTGTLRAFKDRFKPRAEELLKLSETPSTSSVKELIKKLKKGSVKLADLGPDARRIPRYATRDEGLRRRVVTELELETESKAAESLFARSLQGGSSKVGYQGIFDTLKKSFEQRLAASRAATLNRIQSLAKEDIDEIATVLRNLQVVEAELLQQLSAVPRTQASLTGTKGIEKSGIVRTAARDKLTFPGGETWFDEISFEKVDVKKGCAVRGKSEKESVGI